MIFHLNILVFQTNGKQPYSFPALSRFWSGLLNVEMLVWFILVRKFRILSRNGIKYNTFKLLSVARFRQIDHTIDWIIKKIWESYSHVLLFHFAFAAKIVGCMYIFSARFQRNTTSRKVTPNICHATLWKLNASLFNVGNFCLNVTVYWEILHEIGKTTTINFDTTPQQLPVSTARGQKVTRI